MAGHAHRSPGRAGSGHAQVITNAAAVRGRRMAELEFTLRARGARMAASLTSRYGSGKSVKRVEDDALLRGHGRFADNVKVAGELHACFARSPHPHARIVRIDATAASALP